MKFMFMRFISIIFIFMLFSSCTSMTPGGGGSIPVQDGKTFVYTLSNDTRNNSILGFRVESSGELTELEGSPFLTRGRGERTPSIHSQGVLRENDLYVATCNVGSNTISVFQKEDNGHLTLINTFNSGGMRPISLDFSDNILYVLNQGEDLSPQDIGTTPAVITLFNMPSGTLINRYELPVGEFPAEIRVSPDEQLLALASDNRHDDEQALFRCYRIIGNNLREFRSGVFEIPNSRVSFGFDWFSDSRTIALTTALNPTHVAILGINSTTESIELNALANGEMALCWGSLFRDRYFYTGSFRVGVEVFAVSNTSARSIQIVPPPSSPSNVRDLEYTPDGNFVYAIDLENQRILGYRILSDGRLEDLNITNLNIDSLPFGMLISTE